MSLSQPEQIQQQPTNQSQENKQTIDDHIALVDQSVENINKEKVNEEQSNHGETKNEGKGNQVKEHSSLVFERKNTEEEINAEKLAEEINVEEQKINSEKVNNDDSAKIQEVKDKEDQQQDNQNELQKESLKDVKLEGNDKEMIQKADQKQSDSTNEISNQSQKEKNDDELKQNVAEGNSKKNDENNSNKVEENKQETQEKDKNQIGEQEQNQQENVTSAEDQKQIVDKQKGQGKGKSSTSIKSSTKIGDSQQKGKKKTKIINPQVPSNQQIDDQKENSNNIQDVEGLKSKEDLQNSVIPSGEDKNGLGNDKKDSNEESKQQSTLPKSQQRINSQIVDNQNSKENINLDENILKAQNTNLESDNNQSNKVEGQKEPHTDTNESKKPKGPFENLTSFIFSGIPAILSANSSKSYSRFIEVIKNKKQNSIPASLPYEQVTNILPQKSKQTKARKNEDEDLYNSKNSKVKKQNVLVQKKVLILKRQPEIVRVKPGPNHVYVHQFVEKEMDKEHKLRDAARKKRELEQQLMQVNSELLYLRHDAPQGDVKEASLPKKGKIIPIIKEQNQVKAMIEISDDKKAKEQALLLVRKMNRERRAKEIQDEQKLQKNKGRFREEAIIAREQLEEESALREKERQENALRRIHEHQLKKKGGTELQGASKQFVRDLNQLSPAKGSISNSYVSRIIQIEKETSQQLQSLKSERLTPFLDSKKKSLNSLRTISKPQGSQQPDSENQGYEVKIEDNNDENEQQYLTSSEAQKKSIFNDSENEDSQKNNNNNNNEIKKPTKLKNNNNIQKNSYGQSPARGKMNYGSMFMERVVHDDKEVKLREKVIEEEKKQMYEKRMNYAKAVKYKYTPKAIIDNYNFYQDALFLKEQMRLKDINPQQEGEEFQKYSKQPNNYIEANRAWKVHNKVLLQHEYPQSEQVRKLQF